MHLVCGTHTFTLTRPLVMGIVNVTPDSISDGGLFLGAQEAIAQGEKLIAEGADILDIGGESTRPGAAPASLQEELDRIMPVLVALLKTNVAISIDTQKTAVMIEAIRVGAAMINDVNALQDTGAIAACAKSNVAVCLMHKQGAPSTMQAAPRYDDVVREVSDFLGVRAAACEGAGIARERIVIDPGFGFGKTLTHNFTLLNKLQTFTNLGYPVLAGLSRKNSLGVVTGRAVEDRLAASVAAAVLAAYHGATIIRVHDVKETVDALKILQATRDCGSTQQIKINPERS